MFSSCTNVLRQVVAVGTSISDINRLIEMEQVVCMHVGKWASVLNPVKTETVW
jgi:hypothetical protein